MPWLVKVPGPVPNRRRGMRAIRRARTIFTIYLNRVAIKILFQCNDLGRLKQSTGNLPKLSAAFEGQILFANKFLQKKYKKFEKKNSRKFQPFPFNSTFGYEKRDHFFLILLISSVKRADRGRALALQIDIDAKLE